MIFGGGGGVGGGGAVVGLTKVICVVGFTVVGGIGVTTIGLASPIVGAVATTAFDGNKVDAFTCCGGGGGGG